MWNQHNINVRKKLRLKDKTIFLAAYTAYILNIAFMVTGCATTSASLKFTHTEVKLIPVVSIHKVLSPMSTNETVTVRARNVNGPAEFIGFAGQQYVIVMDENRETKMKVAISDITEIERIRRVKRPNTSAEKHQGNTAEAVGETLLYAPMVPVAIASLPFLNMMGLDEGKNSVDRAKALLVYGEMTKEALRESIGEPKQRYLCKSKNSNDRFEVWNYEKDQVLRGGRFLFLNSGEGKVSFSSWRFPSWANCSPAPD
jgi:hypothetical protein